MYLDVLSKIDFSSRKRIGNAKSLYELSRERKIIIRDEIPYNPIEILREASRVAQEIGVPKSNEWGICSRGAWLGEQNQNNRYGKDFFFERPENCNDSDGDKFCALNILSQVYEYKYKNVSSAS